jgi:selenocysteine-specific elongation factor
MGISQAELIHTMQKHIVLGTAGHIDHGKTSLIRALSGIDTDRLPEEKERGITIELGFAHVDLPGGLHIGIVDVPGHEKFVHHMVAGVGGMDLVMLVIAADEGIMPQTREHLSICRLLGVRHGLVALTKIDMVDDEWLDLVQEDIRDSITGTFLENAPVLPVSSHTGAGLENLRLVLTNLAESIEPRNTTGIFRLPIDRVFTIRGFGTVVTGTVSGGHLSNGEIVEIMPGGMICKIRGLQVHGEKVDRIVAGQRAAVNVQNIDRDTIHRGMMLARSGSIPETRVIDAECSLLKSISKPLKNRVPVRLHSGTAEIICRIVLMDRDVLNPGETAFVQFRLTEPAAVLPEDRFVIRSYSPVMTIGGGRFLDAEPFKHKRLVPGTIRHFEQLASKKPQQKLHAILDMAGLFGISDHTLRRRFPDPALDADDLAAQAVSRSEAVKLNGSPAYYVSRTHWAAFKRKLLDTVTDFHKKNPIRPGISRDELRSTLKPQPPEIVFNSALDDLTAGHTLLEHNRLLKAPDFEPTLSPDQKQTVTDMISLIEKSGFDGITQKEIMEKLNLDARYMKPLFQHLLDMRIIQRLPGGLYMEVRALDAIASRLKDLFSIQETLAVGEFRDALSISRKQAVPLLEYFDSIGLTLRKGDVRILRGTGV